MHYLYRIINTENHMVYIGQTSNINRRWQSHKSFAKNPERTGQYIHRAMSKIGIEKFSQETIAMCNNQEDTNFIEAQLINQHNSLAPNGYNLTNGGGVMTGFKHTKESRAKMSKAAIGRIPHPNSYAWTKDVKKYKLSREKASETLKGHETSQETRDKISKAQIGKFVSDETKAKQSIARKGKIPWNKGKKGKIPWNKGKKLKYKE